ncbi:hypothetical protein TI04_10215 [Achromatium sp. WMS2]|nr:hypothetical protein TI04_10215 [Achromatium sp. WMS2]
MGTQLTQVDIEQEVLLLNGKSKLVWQVQDGKLSTTIVFKDFTEAFSFITGVALIAARMNHHPEWYNAYNKVTVNLTTHDTGGISILDFRLADEICALDCLSKV